MQRTGRSKKDAVAIGCSSGFWGDSGYAMKQLVGSGKVDYIVSDYLSEITMSLLARMRMKNADAGYAPDFVESLAPLLPEIRKRGIKIVSNAGGINPRACKEAIEKAANDAGLSFSIAVVEGDDLLPQMDMLRTFQIREMFSGERLPENPVSCNAYLGARPIAAALGDGADIVLTGRCADSALALGILMHEFGWTDDQHDLLAAGSLAGHIIECGPQCTGGVFTDWEDVAHWDNMGYPIVECRADGVFTVTKPEGTGGMVTPATVAEQIIYEIGDPAAYILPDVICDFTNVKLKQDGKDRVTVTGVRGISPTLSYKVSATWNDGWRVITTLMIAGRDAAGKARKTADALVGRTQKIVQEAGMKGWQEVSVEVIGAEDTYGNAGKLRDTAREVVLKIGLRHEKKEALEIFAKEMMQTGVAMAQGTTGVFGGRPVPSPVIRLYSFLLEKDRAPVRVVVNGREIPVSVPRGRDFIPAPPTLLKPAVPAADTVEVPLAALAWGRSGDKGNDANIGIIARREEFVPILLQELPPMRIADFFSHYLKGDVLRWELPGINAFNFLLKDVLGGGGMASLRYDPQGKTYASMLMDLPVRVPRVWLKPGGFLAEDKKCRA